MAYENNWQSLNARPVPKWFGDAKFGIFIHWGLYSVPGYTARGQYAEWYMRQIEDPAHPARLFHDRTYGPNFKYEDFVSGFRAELFDADAWADLFRQAGARYVVPVAEHHDGFQNYESELSHWNAAEMGPHRDITGDLLREAERVGMTVGASTHMFRFFTQKAASGYRSSLPSETSASGTAERRSWASPGPLESWVHSTMPMLNRAQGAQVEPSMEVMRRKASGGRTPAKPRSRPSADA